MANLQIYNLPHNNTAAALTFAKQHWHELRPEDFTTLARLQDDPAALFNGLAKLERQLGEPRPAKKSGAVLYHTVPYLAVKDQLLSDDVLLYYRARYYRVVEAQQEQLTKWVRVVRVRDGKIVQVRREVALAKSHKYKPLKPLQAVPVKPREVPPAPPTTKWVRVLRLRDNKIIQVRREKANQPHKYKPLGPGSAPPRPPEPTEPPPEQPKKPPLEIPKRLRRRLTEYGQQVWSQVAQIPALRAAIKTPPPRWMKSPWHIKQHAADQAERALAAFTIYQYEQTGKFVSPLQRWEGASNNIESIQQRWKDSPVVNKLLDELHEHYKSQSAEPKPDLPLPKYFERNFGEQGQQLWHEVLQVPALRQHYESLSSTADEGKKEHRAMEATMALLVHRYEQTGEFPRLVATWNKRTLNTWARQKKVKQLLPLVRDHFGAAPPKPKEVPPPSVSVRQLHEALRGKTMAYSPTMATERHGKWLLKEQLTYKSQAQVRENLANILAHYGLHNHSATKPGSNKYLLATQLHEDGAKFITWGVHGWDGTVTVRQDVHEGAKRFFAHPQFASEREMDQARTLIHEEVHGHSPQRSGAYYGTGALVEEATTELAARHIVSDLADRAMHFGSYQKEIDTLTRLVKDALVQHYSVGRDVAMVGIEEMVTQAALKMRAPQDHLSATPAGYLRHFANSVAAVLPEGWERGVPAADRAKHRQQLARELGEKLIGSNLELTKRHGQ